MTPLIRVKRIYDEPSAEDGYRVFVDRLWARGVTKQAARIDSWPKDLAPSTELRKWLHEDATRIPAFAQRYRAELDMRRAEVDALVQSMRNSPTVTLVTATRDLVHGHAAVLKTRIEERLRRSPRTVKGGESPQPGGGDG